MKKIFLAFILLSLLTLAGCKSISDKNREPIHTTITVAEAFERMESEREYVILDISTAEECSEEGALEGMINIDYFGDNFREELNRLDKDEAYLLFCRSGKRSAKALVIMEELGFVEVYNVDGGVYEWEEQGYRLNY